MRKLLVAVVLVLILVPVLTSVAFADDPTPTPGMNVDVTVTGDNPNTNVTVNGDNGQTGVGIVGNNTQTDVSITGDNGTVTVNGKVPFDSYYSSDVYDDTWMKNALKTLQDLQNTLGGNIIKINDNLSITIDGVAKLIIISEKQKEFNTQIQNNLNLTAEQMDALKQVMTAIGNQETDLQAALSSLGETAAKQDAALSDKIDAQGKGLSGRIDAQRDEVEMVRGLLQSEIDTTNATVEGNSQQIQALTDSLLLERHLRDKLNEKVDDTIIGICVLVLIGIGALVFKLIRKLKKV